MKLQELEKELSDKLNLNLFSASDKSLNGVQVGDLEQEITKIALLVDASMEGFKQAKKIGANLIIVHHGFFWGSPLAIKGTHYHRVKFLIENNIALYAAHLPLDAHLELGNNAGIAKLLDLKDIEPFGQYRGNLIGIKGKLKNQITLNEVKNRIVGQGEPAYIIPGGKPKISTIAIISGGAPHSVNEAIAENIDLFITGDISHEVYHTCIEEKINMISAGHYATEIHGVKQVGEWIKSTFDIDSIFIDIPTGA
ncbi:MAG: Nif3-like dinuclear metal center hexameric protein [Spirochaetaceae bacterium 4572_7]|nr:MAG: Nif3-like dinuclear metal center hexameric protein [Spirochaetaceae bacterium 4572_7]